MAFVNNTMIIRRELLAKMVSLYKNGSLVEKIDRVPIEMKPKNGQVGGRCCIYKERAILKYKMLPLLGYSINEEDDELTPLAYYATEALKPRERKKAILTVVDEACTGCVKTNYVVTNLCRGCVGRPCSLNCPKEAVTFKKNGQASIDHAKCINCGICKNACPYHTIVYIPIPCEEVCPVKAISKDDKGIEHINEDKCIYCGKCINACPFGSIFEVSQVFDILSAIKRGELVVAMVAPSILSQFDHNMNDIAAAIKKIGFVEVIEVAHGAMETTRREGIELKEKLDSGQRFMTTSCCPTYVELVSKHLNEMKPFLSHTGSPMHYTYEMVREKHPAAKFIFIGPCVGKRKEVMDHPGIDFAMTFEELDCVLRGMEIEFSPSKSQNEDADPAGRGFAQAGGVIGAIKQTYPELPMKPIQVADLNRKNIALLRGYSKGKAPGNFIEVMACEGGCISGPCGKIDYPQALKIFRKQLGEPAT